MQKVTKYRYTSFYPRREAAEKIVATIESGDGTAIEINGDLADPETPRCLFDEVEQRLAPVDILVNNEAHHETPDNIEATSAGGIDRTPST